MRRQKKILTVQDISGYGKCSATIALPVLSAAGHSASLLPTAVLSTHTGGLGNQVLIDLTDQIAPITTHWASIGLTFDAIYTGYAASFLQLKEIQNAVSLLKKQNTILLVDPAMADNGSLYRSCSPELVSGMQMLCQSADWITPNITEAFLLLQQPFQEGPYTLPFLFDLLSGLSGLGARNVVITGITEGDSISVYCLYAEEKKFYKVGFPFIQGRYHGTGDLFSSTLLAALLAGKKEEAAVSLAAEITYRAVLQTSNANEDPRHGLCFEPELPFLWESLK